MTALAAPSGVLHRPAHPPAASQPAHHRRLPRHAADAPGLRRPAHRETAVRLDFADLDAPAIGAFLDHLPSMTGATASGPATPAWPRSTPCSATPPCATPSTPPASSGSWPSRPNAPDRTIVTFLTPDPKQTRSWPPRDRPPAPADATAPDAAGHPDRARASELTGLTCQDVHLGTGPYVACHGKGRKDRITPLTPATVTDYRRLARRTGRWPGRPAVHHPSAAAR